jgi:hypothetical protein
MALDMHLRSVYDAVITMQHYEPCLCRVTEGESYRTEGKAAMASLVIPGRAARG